MPWARASALDRHLECPAASHLPMLDRGRWSPGYLIPPGHLWIGPTVEIDPKDDTAAEWGTAMHSAKALAPDAADPWLTWIGPHRERLWPNGLGEHEVAVSFDCRTRLVETFRAPSEDERTAWKMSRSRDCVVGTADWWGQLPTGEPWIDDLKTGWQEPDVPSNPLLFYLMCRMKISPERDSGRMSATWWARTLFEVDKDTNEVDPGEPTRTGLWRQVTRLTLEQFEEDLCKAWVRAVGLNPEPRPGAHCLLCPSATVCPRANE